MRKDNLYFVLGLVAILIIGTLLSVLTNSQTADKFEREAAYATETAIPVYVANLLSTAQQHITNKNWQEAIAVLTEVVTVEPDSIQGNQLLLQAYVGAGENDTADTFVEQLIEQGKLINSTPERDWIDIVVIIYFHTLEDWQAIVDYVENANPEVTTIANQLEYWIGDAYFQLEDYTNARAYLEKLISRNPNHEAGQFRMGQITFESGEYDASVQHLSSAHAVNTNRKESLLYRGQAYYALGEIELAQADFSRYVEMGGTEDVSKYFE